MIYIYDIWMYLDNILGLIPNSNTNINKGSNI